MNKTKKFIELSRAKWPDYIYSETVYGKTQSDLVSVQCPHHGTFQVVAKNHAQGYAGCPTCGTNKRINAKICNNEQFIKKAKEIHGSRYDYSEVEYVRSSIPVQIICRIHGVFEKRPNNHLANNQGCPKCGRTSGGSKNKLTHEEFTKRVHDIHGDKYDIGDQKYINITQRMTAICKLHNVVCKTSTSGLLSGSECCPKCAKDRHSLAMVNKRLGWDKFLEDANIMHNNKYQYVIPRDFNLQTTKLDITCPEHGSFTQSAGDHRDHRGCPKCGDVRSANAKRCTKEKFLERSIKYWGDRNDYSDIVFKSIDDSIVITCNEHNIRYDQLPRNHMIGHIGCPKCKSYGTEADALYIWKVVGMDNVYKIGITSSRLGEWRIHDVARKGGLKADIKILVNIDNARIIESRLHAKYPKVTNMNISDGKTEFRILSDNELADVIHEITLNSYMESDHGLY